MKKVSVPKVVTAIEASECALPAQIQEVLGELVGAAREGLLALSVGVGLGVDRDHADRRLAVAKLVEERLQGGAIAALSDPDDPARVVVGDDGQLAVPAPVGHLVYADHLQAGETAGIEALGHDALDDRADGVPGDPHQSARSARWPSAGPGTRRRPRTHA